MPIMPPRRKVSADNSGVNALISFLGLNDSDPAQASMDLVNPAVGMAKRAAKRLSNFAVETTKKNARKDVKKIDTWNTVLDHIVVNSDSRINIGSFRDKLKSESPYWTKKKIPTKGLKGASDVGVRPGTSFPAKGEIVVAQDGFVLDGRHRARDAIDKGKQTIEAWVPIIVKDLQR